VFPEVHPGWDIFKVPENTSLSECGIQSVSNTANISAAIFPTIRDEDFHAGLLSISEPEHSDCFMIPFLYHSRHLLDPDVLYADFVEFQSCVNLLVNQIKPVG
jgi:hypothetical protein